MPQKHLITKRHHFFATHVHCPVCFLFSHSIDRNLYKYKDTQTDIQIERLVVIMMMMIRSFIHYGDLYSAPSRLLLRSAPNPCTAKEKSFEAKVKCVMMMMMTTTMMTIMGELLSKVAMQWFEVDSNLRPSDCKAQNIPLFRRVPEDRLDYYIILIRSKAEYNHLVSCV